MIARLTVCVYDSPNGRFIANWSARVQGPRMGTNSHGASVFDATIQLGRADVIWWCSNPKVYHLEICDHTDVVWEGRIEEITPTASGIRIVAYGYWRALSDVPYTSNYVVTRLDKYRPITSDDIPNRKPALFELDTEARLFMGLTKNTTYGVGDEGALGYTGPSGTMRKVFFITFTYELLASSSFRARLVSFNNGFVDRVEEWALVGTGSLQTGTVSQTLAATREFIYFGLICQTGTTYSGENGAHYFRVTNVRISTSANSSVAANEIATSLLNFINTVNPGQLNTSTAFLQSPGVDLPHEVYEDRYPSDIINELIGLGDNQTPPRTWRAYILDRCLILAPRGTMNRTWLVDLDDRAFEMNQSLNELTNSVYGIYEDTAGRTIRGTVRTDNESVVRHGLTRRRAIKVDTTSSTQANIARDAELADAAAMPSRARLSVRRVRTANGGQAAIHEIQAGDTIIVNALPLYNTALDNLQTFVVDETSYNGGNTIEITPAAPPPRLQAQEARRRRYG